MIIHPINQPKAMINLILNILKSNIIYSALVIALLAFFAFYSYRGAEYFPGNSVQKNAGYNGPIPHSGYGVRFYHK